MSAWSPEESHGIKASADRSASMGRRPGGGRRASEHCLGRGNKAGNNAKDHGSIYLSIYLSFYQYLSTYILHYYFRRMTWRESSMLNQEMHQKYFLQGVPKDKLGPIFFCNPSLASSNPLRGCLSLSISLSLSLSRVCSH